VTPRLLVPLLVAIAASPGCMARDASAPATAPPPERQERRRLTEVDALEHDLQVAEQRLDHELGQKLARAETEVEDREEDGISTPSTPPRTQAGDREAGATTEPEAGEPADEPRWDRAELASPCDKACRALLSMKRSADAICRISGDASERCTRARGRVSGAEQRVKTAGCACRAR
jgi:hypothetical protein